WHVVQQGETLSRITVKYLGSSADWRDNWRLNPDIKDPNRLKPGQRIRVILARTLPARSALVNRVARRVEKKPEPAPWTTARPGDQLIERNGIRTFEASSAELKFEDDTVLTLTERSLVFLRGTKRVTRTREASEIEIVDGHADLDKPAPSAKSQDIEIIVGGTTAKPAGGEAKARFRKEGTSAQVMSYRGGANVTSAGASVKVSAGMGVAVPEGKKPPKPEKLLVAPAVAAVDTMQPQPVLRWSAVEGASHYTAEVCRDTGCAEIVARAAMLDAAEWQPPAIEPGEYVLRVSARSASGLDGFAGAAPLRVRRAVVDVTSPADVGSGSLREAIETANAAKAAYEIRILVAGPIALTSPLPRLTAPVTIHGRATAVPIGSVTTVGFGATTLANPTRSETTIDFGGAAIGFDAASSLTLRDLTLVSAATHVTAAKALTLENVVIGTLLARTESTGIEAHGPTTLRRVLITGMLQTALAARGGATIDGEHVEISNSGTGIASESFPVRLRHSLLLLNETGAALAEGGAIEQSTFRGNRTARVLPSRTTLDAENTFDDNLITTVVAGRVTNIRVSDDGRTIVTGTAAPGASVEIYTDATAPTRITAGADGAFEVQLEKEGTGA
ncbi:MAG TPA: FecR domain-containing protein, partial [Thermoanaerobaculia bacterium]|nr:FecR domain-containing protein [Thermoanaerobaculia bacterium]